MVKMNTILTLQIQQWLDYKNTVYEITVKNKHNTCISIAKVIRWDKYGV